MNKSSLSIGHVSEKNMYMRLMLEKLLCSRLLGFLRETELNRLRDSFISLTPGEFMHSFFLDANAAHEQLGRAVVGNFSLSWQLIKEKEQDVDGSLWSSYELCFSVTLRECYSLQGALVDRWLECLSALKEFSDDLKKLNLPKKMKIRTHTPEERIVLENLQMKEKIEQELSFFFMEEGRAYVKNLRGGGKSKGVPYDTIVAFLSNTDQRDFVLKIRKNRWSWSTHFRKYRLVVDDKSRVAHVRRET